MSDEAPLASLSLTHVHYDPSDPISYLCAWLALVPQGLCVVYATLVWSTREAEVALMFAGQLLCEALNFALKRLIKEERPRRMNGKGYGMPSSHAQFVAYFAVSLALFLVVRHRPAAPGKRRNHTPMSLLERIVWSLCGLGMAAAVAWSRIYLNYHTEKQVLVGSGAGAASAVVWFVITSILRQSGWLAWALDLPPARFLRARDLVVEEDLCQAGWEEMGRQDDGSQSEEESQEPMIMPVVLICHEQCLGMSKGLFVV
ncbi:hypothetical protein PG987_008639 [Apiospora arundinis]